jgi:hypothetical protein
VDQRAVPEGRWLGGVIGGTGWAPKVLYTASAAGPQGSLPPTPRGVLQHGSRSDRPLTRQQEFEATDGWAQNPSNPLGWNATIGEGVVSLHLPIRQWGWNAFAASAVYFAVEYAQPTEAYDITDLQVRTHNWLFATMVRPAWPRIPMHFPSHAEVEHSGEIAHTPSGKTDVFSFGSSKMENLRQRLGDNLRREWGIAA